MLPPSLPKRIYSNTVSFLQQSRTMAGRSRARSALTSPVGSPPPADEVLRPWAGSLVLAVLQRAESGDTGVVAQLVAQGWDPSRPSVSIGHEGKPIVMHAIVIAAIEGALCAHMCLCVQCRAKALRIKPSTSCVYASTCFARPHGHETMRHRAHAHT